MSLQVIINVNSLHTIKDQLDDVVNVAASEFENYLADKDNMSNLNASVAAIAQAAGTFRLLEYPGVAQLADEMAELGRCIASPDVKTSDGMIDAYTHNLFVLPRYIEFISVHKKDLPILLMPYINEMRVARRASLLPEFHFFTGDIPLLASAAPAPQAGQLDELFKTVSRLRHMYQTGLLGVITSDGKGLHHYQLLLRPVDRVLYLLGDHSSRPVWVLAQAYISCFIDQSLSLNLNRKRVLAAIEKLLRSATAGDKGLDADFSALKKDLLFALMLSDSDDPNVLAVAKAYNFDKLELSDRQLIEQRESMHGPSIDTMESVINVLKEELRHAKDILEISSQNNGIDAEDLGSLKDLLSRIADTLSILNLTGPMALLKDQLKTMEGWDSFSSSEGSRQEFLLAADIVLFVESALSGLERREISLKALNEATAETRKSIIASSHLAEAERVVLEEAESGIALAKRAITSYVDSNFDSAHIANVATTLNTVRGGLHVLNYRRAAAILKSCSAFIDSHIKNQGANSQHHQLLATLADALISLEYYLGEVSVSRQANEKILDVAEESLKALGFNVENEQ